jgi:dCMP deaminase
MVRGQNEAIRMRAEWDDVWMAMAGVIATRSPCSLRQIGAVIVTADNRPVSVGYNGPPTDFPKKEGVFCNAYCPRAQKNEQTQTYGNCISIHAEANALMFADRRDYKDGTLYVSSFPCWDCAKMVANSGIKRVVTCLDVTRDAHRYPAMTEQMLRKCGLRVEICGS